MRHDMPHVEVRLIDRPEPDENPHLDYVLLEAVRAVEQFRATDGPCWCTASAPTAARRRSPRSTARGCAGSAPTRRCATSRRCCRVRTRIRLSGKRCGAWSTMSEHEFVWRGIVDPSHLYDDVVSTGHQLADAAKAGDWPAVFGLLDDPTKQTDINWWRPGGKAWFTALHQAAWHGAPIDVVVELMARGALRSVTDAKGRTPYGVLLGRAKDIGNATNPMAKELLKPPPSPLPHEQIRALDRHLAGVIDGRIRGVLFDDPHEELRYPPVGILHEVPEQKLWFPVPGMYGGFHIKLSKDHLDVRSWSRIVGGSGQAHWIIDEGATLVEEGFV